MDKQDEKTVDEEEEEPTTLNTTLSELRSYVYDVLSGEKRNKAMAMIATLEAGIEQLPCCPMCGQGCADSDLSEDSGVWAHTCL